MKPGIKEVHNFIKGPFAKQIRDAFEHLEILSEADLQAFAWHLIRDFLTAVRLCQQEVPGFEQALLQ